MVCAFARGPAPIVSMHLCITGVGPASGRAGRKSWISVESSPPPASRIHGAPRAAMARCEAEDHKSKIARELGSGTAAGVSRNSSVRPDESVP